MFTTLRLAATGGDVRAAVDRCLQGSPLDRFSALAAAMSDPDRYRDVWLPAWSRPVVVPLHDERWVEPGLWLGLHARAAGVVVPPSIAAVVGASAKRASLRGGWSGIAYPAVAEDAWAAAVALGWSTGPVLPGYQADFVRRFGPLPVAAAPVDWEAWRWPDVAVAVANFGGTLARIRVSPEEVRLLLGARSVATRRVLGEVVSARIEVSTGRGANRFQAVVTGPAGRRKVSAQRARLVVEDDGPANHDTSFSVDGGVARFEWT
jgi:hypothetical protein